MANPTAYELGNTVAVIGMGNVAMDVARTTFRNGAQKVLLFARGKKATASSHEMSYAKLDGAEFIYGKSIEKITQEGPVFKTSVFDENDKGIGYKEERELIRVDSIIIAVIQGPKNKLVMTTHNLECFDKGLLVSSPPPGGKAECCSHISGTSRKQPWTEMRGCVSAGGLAFQPLCSQKRRLSYIPDSQVDPFHFCTSDPQFLTDNLFPDDFHWSRHMKSNYKFWVQLIKFRLSHIMTFRLAFFAPFFISTSYFLVQLFAFEAIYGHVDDIRGWGMGKYVFLLEQFL